MAFFLRPTNVFRNTYDNIKETGCYTINHVHETIIAEAHHTSAKYPEEISEFDVTKLESEYKNSIQAPFVKNAPVQLLMDYVNEYPIKENGTILVIGKINSLYIQGGLIENDGFINLSKAKIAAINGLDGYAIPKLKTRFDYQRPKNNIE